MAEPESRERTLTGCADNLQRLYLVFKDLGIAIAENYPGLSMVLGDNALELKKEEEFLREY